MVQLKDFWFGCCTPGVWYLGNEWMGRYVWNKGWWLTCSLCSEASPRRWDSFSMMMPYQQVLEYTRGMGCLATTYPALWRSFYVIEMETSVRAASFIGQWVHGDIVRELGCDDGDLTTTAMIDHQWMLGQFNDKMRKSICGMNIEHESERISHTNLKIGYTAATTTRLNDGVQQWYQKQWPTKSTTTSYPCSIYCIYQCWAALASPPTSWRSTMKSYAKQQTYTWIFISPNVLHTMIRKMLSTLEWLVQAATIQFKKWTSLIWMKITGLVFKSITSITWRRIWGSSSQQACPFLRLDKWSYTLQEILERLRYEKCRVLHC